MACLMRSSRKGETLVWMARRSRGGVSIRDISRRPTRDMCSVRGMGVAERESASTFLRISLRRSLWATPKRCSSSTMSKPRCENFFLLRGRAEAAEHLNARGKCREAALKGFKVLEGKNGGRSEKGDLFVVHDGLEGRAHGDFRFAVPYVAAKETVHGGVAFHVALNVGDGGVLVRGFLELEGVFKFALEVAVRRKSEARSGFAFGVKSEKLVSHILDGFAGASLACVPRGAAKAVKRGMSAFHDAVALNEVHALEGDVKAGVLGVVEEHEFPAMAIGFNLAKALEAANAVINVDNEIARLEVGEIAEET